MDFPERFRRAAAHAKVPWSPTKIGESLGKSKQTVDRWMKGTNPRPAELFVVEELWGVSAKWLATEEGPMLARVAGAGEDGLTEEERLLIKNYRAAEPRWQLSLRLLSYVATEQQNEVAGMVNVIIAKAFGKAPQDIKPIGSRRVRKAYGDAPHVRRRREPLLTVQSERATPAKQRRVKST